MDAIFRVDTSLCLGTTTDRQALSEYCESVTRASDILACTLDFVACTSDLVARTSDIVACTSDIVACTSDLVACTSDIVACTCEYYEVILCT